MRFVEINNHDSVNVGHITRITEKDGFAVVHIGIDQIQTKFPYASLLNLLAIESSEIGNGPNPTATALVY